MEKAKRSVDEKRPVYESKKRVAARPYDEMRGSGRGRRGGQGEGEGEERASRREREDGAATKRNGARGKRGRHDGRNGERREEEGAATPGAILLEFK